MQQFIVFIFAVSTLLLTGCSIAPHQSNFIPKYEISGYWKGGAYTDVHRIGRHVFYSVTVNGYEHHFSGKYIDDHTISGTQSRLKLADGTITLMRLTITLASNNSGEVEQVVLDSNSDLRKGWCEKVPIVRVKGFEPSPASSSSPSLM